MTVIQITKSVIHNINLVKIKDLKYKKKIMR